MPTNRLTRKSKQGFPAIALMLALVASTTLGAQERMPPIPPEKMNEAQKKLLEDLKATKGPNVTGSPWYVLLRVPELVTLVEQMRAHTATRSPLPPKMRELIILITARHWTQPFEWHIHYPGALKNGLTLETVTAIADGRRPQQMPEDEQIVYDFSMELHHNHSVSDATYGRALAAFGEPGIVEIAAVNGFYTLLAMVMNTVRMAVPPGVFPHPLHQSDARNLDL